MAATSWLEIKPGGAPLLVSFPHTGTGVPSDIHADLRSEWMTRKDTDWWIHQLYQFASQELGATTVRTRISRTVIDVNRDPSGASLYPGQASTELCPTTTFDGEPLYREGKVPDSTEIARRRQHFFAPYHAAIAAELKRLRGLHSAVVLYDAHSIRSKVPRLFAGELPHLNLGTNGGGSCAAALQTALENLAARSGFSHVVNGRFRGGWITRRYGNPAAGIHAVQMEIACRAYMTEPDVPGPENWPTVFAPMQAAPLQEILRLLLKGCLSFTRSVEEATTLGG